MDARRITHEAETSGRRAAAAARDFDWLQLVQDLGLFLVILVGGLILSFASPVFFTKLNIENLLFASTIIAVLGIVNTLVTSVLERRREFATLQAIGASERQIQTLVLWEASYLGVIGSFLGILGGIALSYMLIAVINKQSFGWTIQMQWTPGVWVLAASLSLVVALVSGYWPARWASRQLAADGLRYE